ncbi:MAG TPA: outer membrane lipoprotein carrier protein LolA [Candidatus Aminicenantes bacterium]|nr:outer membrane lipoprotein carrier protein LolA [Candidatus Aminicenantes bacterium]
MSVMNRLRPLLAGLILLACAARPASVPAGQAVSPEEAAAHLERALRAVATLQARFEQLHYSMAVSEPLRERGELFLQKPDRMRWVYKDPQDKVFLYKEGVLEMYLPEDKQLTRSLVSREALESDIFGIFLGTISFEEAYVIEDSPFPTEATRVRQIKLTPRTEGEFTHILLEIDERTWLLRRAIFLEWEGNKREFVFSQVRTGVRIPAGTFSLKVPPDTEIIDDTGHADRGGR